MDDERTGRGGGGGIPTHIPDWLWQKGGEAKGEVRPSAHIFRLLLAPDDFGIGGVAGK